MQLDYNADNDTFILYVPRHGEHDPMAIQRDEGFNFSRPASSNGVAVLFTKEPYAAVGFWDYATADAKRVLARLRTEIEASWAKGTSFAAKVPFDKELAGFQNADVEYALRRENALIADVPGLGKSMVAMAIGNEIKAEHTTIICPASIRLQWAAVAHAWTTQPYPRYIFATMKGSQGVSPDAHFNIVSYDLARTAPIGRKLASLRTDHLIIDEVHKAKTATTKQARAIFGGGEGREFDAIAANAGRITCLTGTPLPNRPREAYVVARGLAFDAIDWMSEDSFRERFNPSASRQVEKKDGTKVMVVDERSGRHGELQSRLRANFMARHQKRGPDGVGYQLGLMSIPSINIVHVEENTATRAALKAESMLEIDVDNWEAMVTDPDAMGAVATARRLMGEAAAPFALDYIETVLDGGEDKLFVVAHHVSVMNFLAQKLQKYGMRRIDGSTSATNKERLKDEFISDPSIRVFLANILTGGLGLDGLQKVCCHEVVCEPDWVDANNQQVIDRLDRGGQTDHVQADFLVVPGSLCERILAKAIQKGQTTYKALDRRF